MSRIPLVFAGLDYWARTLQLVDGRVQPEGIELHWAIHGPGLLFGRMVRGEFEAGEMSASFLTMLTDQGVNTLVGLPLFTSRDFRHSNFWVRSDAGIEQPGDLKGKRVGVPDYAMTSALWVRGFLKDEYGVDPRDIEWIQGGQEPAYTQRVRLNLPPEIHLATMSQERPLAEMLLKGDLDGYTAPARPRVFANNPLVRPLIANTREAEERYYRQTGVFPITHMVVLRRDVYERHPWMAINLMDAFVKAKQAGWEAFRGYQVRNTMPWLDECVTEIAGVFGGQPYKDGFDANRATLEALTRHSYEQGLSSRVVDPREIFAPETLGFTEATGRE